MKKILASAAVVASASQFLCLLCCIVPTATGLLALVATLGLAGSDTFMLGDLAKAFHPWRPTIMVTAIALISFSWGLWFYNSRRPKIACGCDTKASKRPIFLMVATGLLVFNFITMELLH